MPTSGKPTVVFFGSGPVAAQSLELLAQDFTVEAVVTKPKPAHHRGDFPVLELAQRLQLPVLTASNRRELDELFATKPVTSRLGILIDFGIIVSRTVIDYFELGIINSHFSVLPEWRGADPISFAILSGQATTGVSLMLLVEKMDAGPILAFGEYELPADITTPLLTTHLIHLSDALLKAEVPNYVAGRRKGAPQSITGRTVSYSRKLTKADGLIDWAKPAEQLERDIRAYIDWPKSRTILAGTEVIITKATVLPDSGPPGEHSTENKKLIVYCGQGALQIDRLKPAGKNDMTAGEFVRGYLN